MKFRKIFLIVCDSLGIGEDSSSILYNDLGANTLSNISIYNNGINLKTMDYLGLSNICPYKGSTKNKGVCYGILEEKSKGKDTLTGHWEMMGLITNTPFKTFTKEGFPKELISELEEKSGYKVIGNISASGTEIIKDLGEEHIRTKSIIVYTSADSVLQIAAHEKYFGLDNLYKVCEIAREICNKEKYLLGRIIARPFIGDNKNSFIRTTNRKDYSLTPNKNVLNILNENNIKTISIGKIYDIFNGSGISDKIKTISNHDGMLNTIELTKKDFTGLCFVNLVDFDSLYGHRRDPIGYKLALEEFDNDLKYLLNHLTDKDLLIITADHGNDPTMSGSDHTREYVPLLCYNKKIKNTIKLGKRLGFYNIGKTILDNFNINNNIPGISFLDDILKGIN